MSDKTTYTIEIRDLQNPYGDHDEASDNWGVCYSKAYDTFSDAEEDLPSYLGTYREVQIVKHQRSVAASYKDGVSNG